MNRNTDFRPTSEPAFKLAIARGEPLWTHCKSCGNAFGNENTHTPAGWKDTQITGWCEDCYDNAFAGSF